MTFSWHMAQNITSIIDHDLVRIVHHRWHPVLIPCRGQNLRSSQGILLRPIIPMIGLTQDISPNTEKKMHLQFVLLFWFWKFFIKTCHSTWQPMALNIKRPVWTTKHELRSDIMAWWSRSKAGHGPQSVAFSEQSHVTLASLVLNLFNINRIHFFCWIALTACMMMHDLFCLVCMQKQPSTQSIWCCPELLGLGVSYVNVFGLARFHHWKPWRHWQILCAILLHWVPHPNLWWNCALTCRFPQLKLWRRLVFQGFHLGSSPGRI